MTTTSQTSAEADVVSRDTATTLEPVSSSAPVLISEQEVVFNTAAAALVRPAPTHRHWPGTTLFAAVRRIHIALPEPRPIYPRREASYFDSARMSRLMDHL
jgi:hypothetical protein